MKIIGFDSDYETFFLLFLNSVLGQECCEVNVMPKKDSNYGYSM